MKSSLGAWGVPDYGSTVRRNRIQDQLVRRGTAPLLVTGASGSGKSVVAAHHAMGAQRRAVWLDACGEFMTADIVADSFLRALGRESPGLVGPNPTTSQLVDVLQAMAMSLQSASIASGFTVVVDDLGEPQHARATSGLVRLARLLRSCASQLVLTTRSVKSWPAEVLCDWTVVGPVELALTSDEAAAVLEAAGLASMVPEVSDLRDACGGHMALFTVLASQADTAGVDSAVSRTASLDAWLDRLVSHDIGVEARRALCLASLLRSGQDSELKEVGVNNARAVIRELAEAIPLVTTTRLESGALTFRVHDSIDGFLVDLGVGEADGIDEVSVDAAVRILTERSQLVRASEVLQRHGSVEQRTNWIEQTGSRLLSAGSYRQLLRLVETTPVHELMARPRVLMLWAELCGEMGDADEAIAKAQAARSLAEHTGDSETMVRAISLAMQCLCRRQRFDEAERISEEVLSSGRWQSSTALRGEALVCLGRSSMTRGDDLNKARAALEEATRLTGGLPVGAQTRYVAVALSALLAVLADGDWLEGARITSPLVNAPHQLMSARVTAMGNMGLMLLEAGRVVRSSSLLRAAIDEASRYGLETYVAAYLPSLGRAEAAAGAVEAGVALARRGVGLCEDAGDELDAAVDRVYLSTVLRAAGQPDEALSEAEYAFERLSVADNMGFRRLAALEVAASLLALGDVPAARAWTESVAAEGPRPNRYQMLRSDMILAEAERREGRLDDAVGRLARHDDYIRSENPNWQIAMYCRTFPQLMGVFALAVGPIALPAHLVRMVTPEHSEVILTRTRGFVEQRTWSELGIHLLGDEEFAKFLARDGLPLCHVRMFGGLEVSIGERSVRERDWKKRKARLLFAMLMIRRGHDVSRDQIFEHLWPEMDEDRAKSNLYVIWSTMKSVLLGKDAEKGAKCPYVESVGGVCRSVRENVRTDVDAFERATSQAREAETRADSTAALKAYREISDLYRGDLLPGDCYEDWFATLREHYRAEFMDAMLRATELLLEAGDPHTALIFARRALQHDQFREDLYQAALRCQIAAGQRSSAIDTYMQCRTKLCEELGLDPSAEMRALYDQIIAMEARPAPVDFDPLSD